MTVTKDELLRGLELLGEVLEQRGLHFDLVLIGGGALLLRDLVSRSTADLDVVARVVAGRMRRAKPFPRALVEAVRDVASTLGLAHEPTHDKDWLNPGPAALLTLGLPAGFQHRADVRRFGALVVRIAARQDLVTLKLWAATDSKRGARRAVDIDDLRDLAPSVEELRVAIAWCRAKDGRADFFVREVVPLLPKLGLTAERLDHE